VNDPYEVLGLSPGAPREEVRRAFRRMARRYHPDVSSEPGSRERFEACRAAYEAILDAPAPEDIPFRPGRPGREERERAEEERLRRKAEAMMAEHRAAQAARGAPDRSRLRPASGSGNPQAAEAEARRILAKHPADPEAHGVLGDLALMRGRRAEALHHFSVAAQGSGADARFHQMVELLLSDGVPEARETPRAEAPPPPGLGALAFAAAAVVPGLALGAPWAAAAGLFAAGAALGFGERAGRRVGSLGAAVRATTVGGHPFFVACAAGAVSLWAGLAAYLLLGAARGLAGADGARMLGLAALAAGFHALVLAFADRGLAVTALGLLSGAVWAGVLAGWSLGSLARRA
jgi:hypothetical protein